MWPALLSMDGPTALWIGAKALAYLASLTAAGSALALVAVAAWDIGTLRALRGLGIASACVSVLASASLVPMNAVFLAGGSWAGGLDPALSRMLVEGPLGESLATRVAGLALLAIFFLGSRAPKAAGLAGAALVAVSFALRGHVLAEPRALLAALLTAHLLGIAFWAGALFPLHRMTRLDDTGQVGVAAREFGRKALWVVSGLALAGVGLLLLLAGNPLNTLATPYGRFLAVKLALFLLLLGLAAFNRLRLTPALESGDAGARIRLRRSIEVEAAAVAAILLTTSTLTTLSSPEAAG